MSDTASLGPDLTAAPASTIAVAPTPLPDSSKIGTKDFIVELNKALSSKTSVWRTSKVLSTMLGVDAKDLDVYLKTRDDIESKASKEEGVFLYALKDRLKPEGKTKALVSEEDRYALAKIHDAFALLDKALRKHGALICERSPEAFNSLVKGKACVEAGMVIYANATKSDLEKL